MSASFRCRECVLRNFVMKRGYNKKFLYCKQKIKAKKPHLASSFDVRSRHSSVREERNILSSEESSVEGIKQEFVPEASTFSSTSISVTCSSTNLPIFPSPSTPMHSPTSIQACPSTSTSSSTHETGKRKFQESWLSEIKWISYDKNSDTAKCSICSLYPDLCNKASKVVHGFTSPFKLETFRKHGSSRQHLKCVSAYNADMNNEIIPLATCERVVDQKVFDQLKSVFNVVYYIAKHNKPFSDVEELFTLLNKCGFDILQISADSLSCKEIISHISMVIENELLRTLQTCPYVSLLLDTYTNSCNEEEIILYVRYMKEKQVQESFLSILQFQNKSAHFKLNTIKEFLTNVGLDNLLPDCKPSLVGIGTDGAESLVGKENGLITAISTLSGLEHVVSTCCVAHKLNISVLSSIKNVKYLEKIDGLLKELYMFYYKSPKRLNYLEENAESFFSEILKLQYLADMKWVSSRFGALNALINNYQSIVLHLEEISIDSDGDAVAAKSLLRDFKSFRFVVTIHFLLDFLKVLNSLSVMFQKTDHLLSVIQLHVEKSICRLESMKNAQGKMEEKVISTTTLNGVFEKIQLTGIESNNFKTDKQNILINGITFLKERFSEISNSVINAVAVFDTFAWPSEPELMNYGEEKIKVLGLHFHHLLSPGNADDILDSLLDEWHEFKVLGQGQTFKQLLERTVSMSERFPILSKLLSIVAVLPVSTISCERGYSFINLMENKFRNSIEMSCLKELMIINLHGPRLEDFDPSKAIDQWCFSSHRI